MRDSLHGEITVMLVDEEDLTRSGIVSALETERDIRLVAEVNSGPQVISAAMRCVPDIVIMDVRFSQIDGIDVIRGLTAGQVLPAPKIIILTRFDLDDYLYQSLRAGASGFLLKNTSCRDLVSAIRTVAAGEAVICPPMTRRLLDHFEIAPFHGSRPRVEIIDVLSERELDVLGALASGKTNKEIARDLKLSLATVKCHVSNVLAKLGLRDRVQAALLAQEAGLIAPARFRDRTPDRPQNKRAAVGLSPAGSPMGLGLCKNV